MFFSPPPHHRCENSKCLREGKLNVFLVAMCPVVYLAFWSLWNVHVKFSSISLPAMPDSSVHCLCRAVLRSLGLISDLEVAADVLLGGTALGWESCCCQGAGMGAPRVRL